MEKIKFHHEGKIFTVTRRSWEEFHGITAAVMTLNEEKNIKEFLEHIKPHVKSIVMVDGGSVDNTVVFASSLADKILVVEFTGHYSNQRNRVMELVETDWTLQLDPDERLMDRLWEEIPNLIDQNEYDCWKIPRREHIDGVEIPEVYPDYQPRLFRSYCRFIRPTHNELVGFKKAGVLPQNCDLDIIHNKPKDRHMLRNSAYQCWEPKYVHELGHPGAQIKNTFGSIY